MTEAAAELAAKPVIICYDGSKDGVEAVAFAAALLPGAPAIVVTVWKPIVEEMLTGPGATPPISDPVDANERARRAASDLAREGARRASEAGLEAEPLAIATTDAFWKEIEEAAHERDARLIVCGTSRSGVSYALPGSLASALVQHASRPVLVVPSAKTAVERRRDFERSRRSPGPRQRRSGVSR
jgi:nucleotide-binding universal stress UspA family protein